ncbi:hypothetical protein NMD1_03566 [Novosphingobium sp. MD-1]|nr:hypothetical protein NMD1_03566 [Novosphingobium sp. MD-1]
MQLLAPTLATVEGSEIVCEDEVRVQSPGVEFVKFVVLIVMSPDALIWL